MSTRRSRGVLWLVGGTLAIGGVVVGVEVMRRTEGLIADMVRTPAGCSSTVRFTGTGEYFVYIETTGVVGDLGSCSNDERVYDLDKAPDAEVSITSVSGSVVDMNDDRSIDYDTNEFSGVSVYSFEVDRADEYVVTVSGDADAVAAIGRNAATEAQPAFIVAAVTTLIGTVLLVTALIQTLSSRRRTTRAPLVVNYADGTTTWAPPTPEQRAVRDDAER